MSRERSARRRERAASRGPIWARPEPGARRPRYTRDEIAAAALAIADREGFDAVSMRRLARELGAGTMSLYHYVRTKDDLLALMDDALMGELLVPDGELPERLARGADGDRPAHARRLVPASVGDRSAARRAVRPQRDEARRAVARRRRRASTSSPAAQLEVIGMVDDYVLGFCIRDGAARSSLYDEEGARAMRLRRCSTTSRRSSRAATSRTPAAWSARVTSRQLGTSCRRGVRPGRFERGLDRLLDGIELDMQRRRGRKGPFRRS